MSKAIITESKLTAIADAIRSRFGVSRQLTVDEMAETILPHLPSAYQQVEYIESSGTQYIDTGIVPTQKTKIIHEKAYTSNTYRSIDGLWTSSNPVTCFLCGLNYNFTKLCICVGLSDTSWVVGGDYDTNFHTYEMGDGSQKLDGTEIGTKQYSSVTISYCIGKANNNSLYSKAKHKRFERYENGLLTEKFVPCYRKSDKVIGMYDIINGQFHTNAGTGNFTCYPAPPSN